MKLLLIPVLALAGLAPLQAQAAGQAHVHGLATLDIAVEAKAISVQLSSPLDNLLGTERAPRTEAERHQAHALVARLKSADSLLRIDPAAHCRLAQVTLSSSALQLGQPQPAEAGHADIDATFEFQCADAGKASYLDVGLFEFPRLQHIAVQVAAPQGQFKRALQRPAARIALTR